MGRIVVVAYRPKPGKNSALKALIKKHVPLLREEGLATERQVIVMQSSDGALVEIFEWVSELAINRAHDNEKVQTMWQAFSEVCDFVPVGALPESSELFSEFEALDM